MKQGIQLGVYAGEGNGFCSLSIFHGMRPQRRRGVPTRTESVHRGTFGFESCYHISTALFQLLVTVRRASTESIFSHPPKAPITIGGPSGRGV